MEPLAIAIRINELYRQAESLAGTAKENASKAIAIAVECGGLLCNEKAKIGHGGWLGWLKANCPDISERTAQKYMRLSRKLAELGGDKSEHGADLEIAGKVSSLLDGSPKTLRQAYIAAGVIPEPAKQNMPTDKVDPTITFTRHIDAFVLWYRKRTESDPVENWNPQTRSLLINELRPWVEIYNELAALQESGG